MNKLIQISAFVLISFGIVCPTSFAVSQDGSNKNLVVNVDRVNPNSAIGMGLFDGTLADNFVVLSMDSDDATGDYVFGDDSFDEPLRDGSEDSDAFDCLTQVGVCKGIFDITDSVLSEIKDTNPCKNLSKLTIVEILKTDCWWVEKFYVPGNEPGPNPNPTPPVDPVLSGIVTGEAAGRGVNTPAGGGSGGRWHSVIRVGERPKENNS